jgi:hypothetical protein
VPPITKPITPKPPKTPTKPPKVPTVVPPKPSPTCVEGMSDIFATAFNEQALFDTTLDKKSLVDSSEYGYGFWMRYLTRYPQVLTSGKNQPWYVVSRLTSNAEYKNVEMGDRTLAVF